MTEKNETGWNFDNSYARLPETFYVRQKPAPVRAPKLIVLNESLAAELGLNAAALRSGEGAGVFAGNLVPEGAEPLAQAYAGHQFGHFTMLGDGRAILLGEQITPRGERVDIQLKGSGRTPFSRGGDGRAALGPMLREYIVSEAMHALGIPTTRSLAVTATGEGILRESELPGAVLTRTAASHVRVGTFQFAAARRDVGMLRLLTEYTAQRHFPNMEPCDALALSLIRETIRRQASLVARWMLVGFIHGVMNTDNMAVSGETIDYGPCAFMDAYDPATVFSSIDRQGRYAYGNQPYIAAWNVARLAESLLPLLHDNEEQAAKLADEALASFGDTYRGYWMSGMRKKLGLLNEEAEDEALALELLGLMQKYQADFTGTFLALTFDRRDEGALFAAEDFAAWEARWRERLGRQPDALRASSQQAMRDSNPAVIPRNHRVEEALEAAVEHGDYSVMERLVDALAHPYAHTPEQAEYAAPPARPDRSYRTYCGT